MIKTKWLDVSTDNTLQQIAEKLNHLAFRRGAPHGFELINLTRSSLQAKFIEETVSNEIIVDPFGDEIVNSIRRYSIFEFEIFPCKKSRFLLKIANPPRALKSFVMSLSDALGIDFSISVLEIDVLKLMNHLSASANGKGWSMKKIRLSSVKLTDAALAKLEVISNTDAYREAKSQISLKGAVLERATVEVRQQSQIRSLEISATGMIVGDSDFLDDLIPKIQSYFLD